MTLCNPFANLNSFIGGISNSFTPLFSCWNMPPNFGCGIFGAPMFNFNFGMPSLFNFPPPVFNLTPSMDFNIPLPSFANNSGSVFGGGFNYTLPQFTFSSTSGIGDTFSFSSNKQANLSGYNASAGNRLARVALNSASGTTGKCARYVKNAIANSGLGAYKSGHAYQMTGILRQNKNFKEISPSSVNVKDLPAGCVLVYDRGVSGVSSKYGHTEITTGDGRAVSDHVTKRLNKTPSAIFIPV